MLLTTLIGLPVGFALSVACVFLILMAGIPLELFVTKFLHSLNSDAFLAVPFFILVGQFMNTGGMTQKFLILPKTSWVLSVVGWLRSISSAA